VVSDEEFVKIVSFANQKGGVGKTTTAVTLAHGLALAGRRVLLVDMDSQGHVALSLGLPKSPGLFGLICENRDLPSLVVGARENLDVLPGDKHTEAVQNEFAKSPSGSVRFLEAITGGGYDVVLLDMAPSLDSLHASGLLSSNWVVIPTRMDSLSVDGLQEVIRSMGEFSRRGHFLEGYCILPTFFDRTTRETYLQFQSLIQTFGGHLWPPIPQDTRVREAPAYGRTLWEYAPSCLAMKGLPEDRRRIGGYRQILTKFMEVLDA
jgi:chromosome partitioning protein